MVYLSFPSQITDEESMLQKKYNQLRKKKKALQLLKTPKAESSNFQQTPKRAPETKYDAKEMAKILLKSGAISAIKFQAKETQGFKRSKMLERRRNTADTKSGSNAVAGYQPFSSTQAGDSEEDTVINSSPPTKPQMKDLYDRFVSAQETEEKPEPVREVREHRERPPLPKQGNTVYCNGYGVTEEILRRAFAPYGNIINVSMELDKNCGFITFDKMDSAAKAISEMNGSCSASTSQKGSHRDLRDVVTYEDTSFE
ncbi:Negative elongation factor E [Nymphon striatum]|nr:Negative elongation factor E [Nymphon striatum]